MHVGLVLCGNPDTVSGGFLYDRMVRDFLVASGDTVDIISLPKMAYFRSLATNCSSFLINRLEQSSPDILLQDELAHPYLFLMNKKITKKFGLPKVAIIHHLRSCEHRRPWKNQIFRAIEKKYLDSLDGFIFNSNETRRIVTSLMEKQKPSVVALPGGDRFTQTITREDITAKAMKPGPLEIIFLGNVIPRKGLHVLVDALGLLSRSSWHLTVAGDLKVSPLYAEGVMKHVNRAGLQEKIDFVGSPDDADLCDLFCRSHLLVVPSFYEGFGIVYLEAMGFGVPVIASRAGGAQEIVTHGKDGYLLTPGDVQNLSHYIDRIIHNRDLLCTMALAARERFLLHPSWSDTGLTVHAFLHKWGGC